MKIADILTRESIIESLEATNKKDTLLEISERAASLSPLLKADKLFKMLMEREEVCSTALDHGVAVPHLRMHGLLEPIATFARSTEGVEFGSLDGKPTHLFMTIIASEARADEYIYLLSKVTSTLKKPQTRERIASANSGKDILETLIEEDDRNDNR